MSYLDDDEMKLPGALKRYRSEEFSTQLKVIFTYNVMIALAVLIKILLGVTLFLHLNYTGLNLNVILSEVAVLLTVYVCFFLLVKGWYKAATHLLIIAPMVFMWLIIWLSTGDPISRINTIIFIFPLLSAFLLYLDKYKNLLLFFAGFNVLMFAVFLTFQGETMGFSPSEYIDTLTNVSLAIVFTAGVIHMIFRINKKVLKKSNEEIVHRRKIEASLRESESKYRSLLENAFDGIFLLHGYRLEYVNEQFCRITGYDRADLLSYNSDLRRLLADQSNGRLRFLQKGWDNSVKGIQEIQISTKYGEIKDLEISLSGLSSSGDQPRYIGVVRDVTEKKKIDNLNKEINIARQSAEFKQSFLTHMSHEIRTPLTGVLAMAEVLSKSSLTISQKRHLNMLIQSGENLREIINLVLDYSKLEAGKISLKEVPFHLNDLLEESRNLFSSICHNSVEFLTRTDPGLPEVVRADKQKIGQIIRNFLSNAVKFTDQGTITLKLSSAHDTANTEEHLYDVLKLKVEVTDTGLGIDPKAQQALFVPFNQVENGQMQSVGTGLGLSISKELAHLLGGEIGVESQPGQGSKFWFTFCASTTSENTLPQKTSDDAAEKPERRLRILLVEDKDLNQKVITILLESLGHTVKVACNGLEALDMFQPGEFDLILMDVQMPVMDGITATQKLKEAWLQLPPVIGLSANAFEGDREKYMRLGMDEYLTKPVDLDEFARLVRQMGLAEE